MKDSQTVGWISMNPNLDLHIVKPLISLWDLQFFPFKTQAIIIANEPIMMLAQDIGKICP